MITPTYNSNFHLNVLKAHRNKDKTRMPLTACLMDIKNKIAITANGYTVFGSKLFFEVYHNKLQNENYYLDLDYTSKYNLLSILPKQQYPNVYKIFNLEKTTKILEVDLSVINRLNKQKLGGIPISFTENKMILGNCDKSLFTIDLTYLLTIKNLSNKTYIYIADKEKPIIFSDKLTKDFSSLEWWLGIMPMHSKGFTVRKIDLLSVK